MYIVTLIKKFKCKEYNVHGNICGPFLCGRFMSVSAFQGENGREGILCDSLLHFAWSHIREGKQENISIEPLDMRLII